MYKEMRSFFKEKRKLFITFKIDYIDWLIDVKFVSMKLIRLSKLIPHLYFYSLKIRISIFSRN